VDVGEEAYFQGDGFVEMDKALLPHTPASATEVIAVDFSTQDANGILVWHGQKPDEDGRGQDFVALASELRLLRSEVNKFVKNFVSMKFADKFLHKSIPFETLYNSGFSSTIVG
jgi:hypothetical protein